MNTNENAVRSMKTSERHPTGRRVTPASFDPAFASPPARARPGALTVVDPGGGHVWTHQFGTFVDEQVNGIVTDANGNVKVAGSTSGALKEGSQPGSSDAFVRAYDISGNDRWTRRLGTVCMDQAQAVATDETGNASSVGQTNGALEGTSLGGYDAFTRKYRP